MSEEKETVKDDETGERIPFPCKYCTGDSAVFTTRHGKNPRMMTSQEFCKEVDTCTTTVDWDRVFRR